MSKNYSEAMTELENIVEEIEQGEISVDELSEKIKRAGELIRYCKKQLKSTEENVDKLLEDLNEE